MTYKGNKVHPTYCGGVISVLFSTFLFLFFGTRWWILIYKDGDEFFQSKITHDVSQNFIKLTPDNLNLEVSFIGSGVNQTGFDMNEIFSFKLHRYSSLTDDDPDLPAIEGHNDIDIPMVPCSNEANHTNSHGVWDQSATKFCPKYNGEIFGGSYYLQKYSWLRLAVHRCNSSEIINVNGKKQNKTCQPPEV